MSNLKPSRAKLFSELSDSTLLLPDFYARLNHFFWRNSRASIRLFDDLFPRFRLWTRSFNSTRWWPSVQIFMRPHTHGKFLHHFARGRPIFFQPNILARLDPSFLPHECVLHALLVPIFRRHATRLSSWEVHINKHALSQTVCRRRSNTHIQCAHLLGGVAVGQLVNLY